MAKDAWEKFNIFVIIKKMSDDFQRFKLKVEKYRKDIEKAKVKTLDIQVMFLSEIANYPFLWASCEEARAVEPPLKSWKSYWLRLFPKSSELELPPFSEWRDQGFLIMAT